MSATPRTDALDRQLAGFNAFKNLSSDLEAELAAAIARISELESHVRTDNSAVIVELQNAFEDEVTARAKLEAECAGLREDAERYRWLRSECGRYIDWDELESVDGDISEEGFDNAIDAARRKK